MLIPDHCDRGGECWKGFLEIEVIRWRDAGGTLADRSSAAASFIDGSVSKPHPRIHLA